ncbi:MAG TPA: Fur family transcriptional regulator [Coriobacteriia bacterium]|nr:Fur family transcriptional regulator [Coriobacteriia bacterium]
MLDRESAYERLRSAGLRLTPQRRAVVEALLGDDSHPTVDEVAERVRSATPGVSLSTVYKVLHELADLGLVRAVDVPGAMRFDPDSVDHIHVACESCGRIVDAPLPETVASLLAGAAAEAGARASRVDIIVRGTCEVCASES